MQPAFPVGTFFTLPVYQGRVGEGKRVDCTLVPLVPSPYVRTGSSFLLQADDQETEGRRQRRRWQGAQGAPSSPPGPFGVNGLGTPKILPPPM